MKECDVAYNFDIVALIIIKKSSNKVSAVQIVGRPHGVISRFSLILTGPFLLLGSKMGKKGKTTENTNQKLSLAIKSGKHKVGKYLSDLK